MSFTVIIENQIRSHTGLVLWQWRGKGRGLGRVQHIQTQCSAVCFGKGWKRKMSAEGGGKKRRRETRSTETKLKSKYCQTNCSPEKNRNLKGEDGEEGEKEQKVRFGSRSFLGKKNLTKRTN